jgi:hypothetical protein
MHEAPCALDRADGAQRGEWAQRWEAVGGEHPPAHGHRLPAASAGWYSTDGGRGPRVAGRRPRLPQTSHRASEIGAQPDRGLSNAVLQWDNGPSSGSGRMSPAWGPFISPTNAPADQRESFPTHAGQSYAEAVAARAGRAARDERREDGRRAELAAARSTTGVAAAALLGKMEPEPDAENEHWHASPPRRADALENQALTSSNRHLLQEIVGNRRPPMPVGGNIAFAPAFVVHQQVHSALPNRGAAWQDKLQELQRRYMEKLGANRKDDESKQILQDMQTLMVEETTAYFDRRKNSASPPPPIGPEPEQRTDWQSLPIATSCDASFTAPRATVAGRRGEPGVQSPCSQQVQQVHQVQQVQHVQQVQQVLSPLSLRQSVVGAPSRSTVLHYSAFFTYVTADRLPTLANQHALGDAANVFKCCRVEMVRRPAQTALARFIAQCAPGDASHCAGPKLRPKDLANL